LIKGLLEPTTDKRLGVISSHIKSQLNLPSISVLMGANIASEIAQEEFTETTLGYDSLKDAEVFKSIFETPYFKVSLIKDVVGVELCGGLKNIVALGAGIASGCNHGANTRAAVIRNGLLEMRRFIDLFYPATEGIERVETFFESCGIADLIATCESGRNARVAAAFVKAENKSFAERM
jgi:glycerol-3-phosphate dehydrogenase (NAD+)